MSSGYILTSQVNTFNNRYLEMVLVFKKKSGCDFYSFTVNVQNYIRKLVKGTLAALHSSGIMATLHIITCDSRIHDAIIDYYY